MSVDFRSSKRRRRLMPMEAMVLLRDWPLVLVIYMLYQLFDEHHSLGSHASGC